LRDYFFVEQWSNNVTLSSVVGKYCRLHRAMPHAVKARLANVQVTYSSWHYFD